MTTIVVRHNIEVAHRLSQLPGKCEAIHGHSMWVDLELAGYTDTNGLLEGLDFGTVKAAYREHLDSEYDHHLLLNAHDPLITTHPDLPGVRLFEGDPTTENIAAWIGGWAMGRFPNLNGWRVRVAETHVNAATWQIGDLT